MLVLSRKPSEVIILRRAGQEDIRVILVESRGDKSRLGFEAPPDVEVIRLEKVEGWRNRKSVEQLLTNGGAGQAAVA